MNRVWPSDDVATAVGYQPAGISPATRMPVRSIRTTATALFPAIATYSVRPSGESASALGSLPVGARGESATVTCSTTVPVRRSTRATPFAPAPPRPPGSAPAPAGPARPEPRRDLSLPHDRSLHRVDPHQSVRPVAAVRDHQRTVGQGDEAQRQRAHGHEPAGGPDAPARRQERRAVALSPRHDARGEEGEAGERWQGEQGSDAHGANIAAREPDVIPLGGLGRALLEARPLSFPAVPRFDPAGGSLERMLERRP